MHITCGMVGLGSHDYQKAVGREIAQFTPNARGNEYAARGAVHTDLAAHAPIVHHHCESTPDSHHYLGTRPMGMTAALHPEWHIVNPKNARNGERHTAERLGEGQTASRINHRGNVYQLATLWHYLLFFHYFFFVQCPLPESRQRATFVQRKVKEKQ